MKARQEWKKVMVLVAVVVVYLGIGGALWLMVNSGMLERAPIPQMPGREFIDDSDNNTLYSTVSTRKSLEATLSYFEMYLRQEDGHINTYHVLSDEYTLNGWDDTNSEALTYYLQIMAQRRDKERFDEALSYIERNMLHPQEEYLMWRLTNAREAVGEGRNMAPDAELRALRALYIAKDQWGDPAYDELIDTLATSIERVAVTDDHRIAAYGGVSGETVWRGDVSYLAYSDFEVYDRLEDTRRGNWSLINDRMRELTLGAQLENGLYNSEWRPVSGYGNGIDGGVYSINSMWIMVRFAESNDPILMESARESLEFYIDKYLEDKRIYSAYTSSGEVAIAAETPWTYALVGRAASALGEDSFANIMENRMRAFHDLDPDSPTYGAIIEGGPGQERVSQFTMQEAILTMQEQEGLGRRFS